MSFTVQKLWGRGRTERNDSIARQKGRQTHWGGVQSQPLKEQLGPELGRRFARGNSESIMERGEFLDATANVLNMTKARGRHRGENKPQERGNGNEF